MALAALDRVSLAFGDLPLLDQVTLQIEPGERVSVIWLETFLSEYPGTVVFVTHDRAFLQRVATRIVELDRGRLTSWPGDYATFLKKKEEWLANEAARDEQFVFHEFQALSQSNHQPALHPLTSGSTFDATPTPADQPIQRLNVRHERFPAIRRESIPAHRTALRKRLADRDIACFLQLSQLRPEVSIRLSEELLQTAERQMVDSRQQHARRQAGAMFEDIVEAIQAGGGTLDNCDR